MNPLGWLERELTYSTTKHGDARFEHDLHMIDSGVSPDGFWIGEVLGYVKRAEVLGLDNPLGRQALAKGFAVYEAMLESVERTCGPLPEPGHPSGVIR